jgi:hypothetical protein
VNKGKRAGVGVFSAVIESSPRVDVSSISSSVSVHHEGSRGIFPMARLPEFSEPNFGELFYF